MALIAIALISGFGTINAATVIKVGSSPTPHVDNLEAIQPQLAKEGITLDKIMSNPI
jgi:ABC-type metal ion transport system substrate-binding protein